MVGVVFRFWLWPWFRLRVVALELARVQDALE